MKILIITTFFPPNTSVASLRPYSWAKYWSQLGHEVTVMTVTRSKYCLESHLPCSSFNVEEVSIPGISLLRRLVDSKFLRRPKNSYQSPPESVVSPPQSSIRNLIRCFQKQTGCFAKCRMPDLHDLWAMKIIRIARRSNWDVVVSTAWPYSVHLAASYLHKHNFAGTWVADWRDLWVDNHIYPGLPFFRSIERALEKKICQQADIVTTVSPPLADILAQKYCRNVEVIYNGFDEDDFTCLPEKKIYRSKDEQKTIVYTGTIYPPFQDPSPLFRAIKLLAEQGRVNPAQLKVVFYGSNANMSQMASAEGVEDFVEYAGFLPRHEALKRQQEADALLFLEFESKKIKGILTGKLFEYLYAGPPILAIGVNDESGPGQIIKELNAGLCCGTNLDIIKNVLEELLDGSGLWTQSRESTKHNRKRLQFYSRKNQAEIMLELISNANRAEL